MGFLFILSIIGIGAGLAFLFVALIEEEGAIAVFGAILLLLSLAWLIPAVKYDADRAINSNVIIEKYGVITSVSTESMEINGDYTYNFDSKVANLKIDFKIGDLVKVKYLEGVINDYVVEVKTADKKE